jgi:membrane-associated phospholipid phosphatase
MYMNPWYAVTQLGLPEAWSSVALGMVLTYLILRHTSWREPSAERRAFKAATVLLVFTLILAFVAVHAVKVTAQVPRPCIPCGEGLMPPDCNTYCTDGYSFPSGHAATIFSVCTVAFLFLRRRFGPIPGALSLCLLTSLQEPL